MRRRSEFHTRCLMWKIHLRSCMRTNDFQCRFLCDTCNSIFRIRNSIKWLFLFALFDLSQPKIISSNLHIADAVHHQMVPSLCKEKMKWNFRDGQFFYCSSASLHTYDICFIASDFIESLIMQDTYKSNWVGSFIRFFASARWLHVISMEHPTEYQEN